MRFSKFISVILHPIVIPTIGLLIYFIVLPNNFNKNHKLTLLSIVFIATYLIPLFLLVLLKSLGYIKSYEVHSIKERKIPLFAMIVLFVLLGKTFLELPNTRDFTYLFYGTSLALIIVYILFSLKIKASLHLLSIGSFIGFFLTLQIIYVINILPLLIIFFVLAGILATARLNLKAHKPQEVYIGFFIGLICQVIVYYFL